MKRYKFIKPYSATVTVGGFAGLSTKSYNIGDLTVGEPTQAGVRIRIAEYNPILQTPEPSNTSYQEFLIVPNEYLEEYVTPTILSPFTPKNILIAVVVIAAIYGVLKLTKII